MYTCRSYRRCIRRWSSTVFYCVSMVEERSVFTHVAKSRHISYQALEKEYHSATATPRLELLPGLEIDTRQAPMACRFFVLVTKLCPMLRHLASEIAEYSSRLPRPSWLKKSLQRQHKQLCAHLGCRKPGRYPYNS